jgi:hypothetical protein
MDPARFGVYTTIGCIPWTAALGYAGYAVGKNWHSVENGFHGPTYVIAALVVIALASAAWRFARLRRAGAWSAGGEGVRRAGAPRRPPGAHARPPGIRPPLTAGTYPAIIGRTVCTAASPGGATLNLSI